MPKKSREDLRIKVITELCKCKPDYLSVIAEIKRFLTPYRTMDEVIDAACEVGGCTREELISKSRKDEVVLARHLCFYELKRRGSSKKRVAKIFKRERTGLDYGASRISEGFAINDPFYVNGANRLYDILYPQENNYE